MDNILEAIEEMLSYQIQRKEEKFYYCLSKHSNANLHLLLASQLFEVETTALYGMESTTKQTHTVDQLGLDIQMKPILIELNTS